jgi:alpha,alpha-trehalase
MVRSIFSATGDLSLASRAVPVLLQEYEFWTTEPHEVIIRDGQGREHRLSRYSAHWDQARPECSTIDKSIVEGLSKLTQQQLYHDIATAAESGWDFSSRWMEDEEQLSSLKTSSIIPVDLNAFLLQMESDIAFFAKALNNASLSKRFTRAADARRRAFEAILWNEGKGQWLDYWLPLQQKPAKQRKTIYTWDSTRSNRTMYASNFVPLWCGIFPAGDSKIDQVVEALSNSGLVLPGGVATSLLETGQQWDFPNAWAPLQHMIIEGLYLSGSRKARAMAQGITVSWLRSNYTAFQRIGHMVEKYDARYCGEVGGGGEYITQTGFGWTNGVVLTLLHDYGWPEDLPLDCVRAS